MPPFLPSSNFESFEKVTYNYNKARIYLRLFDEIKLKRIKYTQFPPSTRQTFPEISRNLKARTSFLLAFL
ncbi:hypothetical protein MT325_m529R [Paramecium bursaria chlorella virus MT325]|uniref:Uncharacterized protein m529R n=1 Tax=Paramecium bursaria Chlorella virus MT325 TaxID=346932 RepID=A7IUQ9_PBCVM|nr:hypothetical protein MT325_m529R [Paramecium bursaria chlorella virus MT325]